jgi:hypothetical protein
MSGGYESHADYMNWVAEEAQSRQEQVESALRQAFLDFIERREVEVVLFQRVSAHELAEAFISHPIILKPILAACNVAARAIERDLSVKNLNTYEPRLTREQAMLIAGYVKPFLPTSLEIPSLTHMDRVAFIDKEVRKIKGQWETRVLQSLSRQSGVGFWKRMFYAEGEQFELDAAFPAEGEVQVGVDIKRIEARRDIHKRCDEILNKAAKLKSSFPKARFGAVIYYPFVEEQINIQNRLRSNEIDCLVFASQGRESMDAAVLMLLSALGLRAP